MNYVHNCNTYSFFRNAYKKREFRSILEKSGFKVIFSKKIGFLWGLRELNMVDGILKRLETHNKSENVPVPTKNNEPIKENIILKDEGTIKSFIKRVVIKEDVNLFPPLAILQALFSNMIFFICIPKK